jgi:hypothetical protein
MGKRKKSRKAKQKKATGAKSVSSFNRINSTGSRSLTMQKNSKMISKPPSNKSRFGSCSCPK